ncbi:MAG: phosphatase PAP2 family protein [Bacteroidales bacterium]|jgi:membrane-associated phospholipid phosphatase|nr:phosphatase PAP2 family protein [Bacteroidales bacterium]MDD4058539.1 phosphatase PAP2 family protein [Bacteroidales bacterium]
MKKLLIIILTLLISTPHSFGANLYKVDTTKIDKRVLFSKNNMKRLILPSPFIVTGIAMYGKSGERFQQLRTNYFTNFSTHADEFLRFSPTLLLYSLKAAGVESRSSWERMILTNAIAGVLMVGSVQALKMILKEPRPDGSESNGFPSGHSALAFVGATMVHHEYGLTNSPWYSVAAYSLASATAALRVLNNSHYMQDVIMGAGMGILSTEIGYMIGGMIYGNRGLLKDSRVNAHKGVPENGYSFTGASLEYVKILNLLNIDGEQYNTSWGTGATLESIFYNPSRVSKFADIGLHFSANANTAMANRIGGGDQSRGINWLTLSLGPALSIKAGNIMRIGITAEAGYSRLILNNNQINEKSSSGFYAGASLFCERELIDGVVFRIFAKSRNSIHTHSFPDISSLALGGTMSISLY